MRFWIYSQIVSLLLLATPVMAHECGTAGNPPCIGLTACGAPDVGELQDTDSFAICRAGSTAALKGTTTGITNYVQARLNGVMAPAVHDHSTATQTSSGFESATDKLKLDSSLSSSKAEGAIADGTWHSLASQGYTVASARARWPYLHNSHPWLAYGATLTNTPPTITVTSTSPDPIMNTYVTITGTNANKILKLRYRRLAGAGWDGTVYLHNATWTEVSSVSLGANPAIGNWVDATIDLTTATGTFTWIGGTISEWRFDFGNSTADVFEIESISLADVPYPMPTFILNTDADLAAYGIDWSALQGGVYKSTSTGHQGFIASSGRHVLERTITVPSQFDLAGDGELIPLEGTFDPATPLVTIVDNSYRTKISLTFSESLKSPVTAGVYTAIGVGAGSSGTIIDSCYATNMHHLAKIPSGGGYRVTRNETFRVAQALELTSASAGYYDSIFDGNRFMWGYREGLEPAIKTVGNVGLQTFKVTNNIGTYSPLFYHEAHSAASQMVDISENIQLGNANDPNPTLVHFVTGTGGWENKMMGNILWTPTGVPITAGGMSNLKISGNTAGHLGDYGPFIRIAAHITNLHFSDNTGIGYGGKSIVNYIEFNPSLIATGNTSTEIYISGNWTSVGIATINHPSIYSTANVKIIGSINETISPLLYQNSASDQVVPPSVENILPQVIGATNGRLILPAASAFPIGKKYTVTNRDAATNITVYSASSIYRLSDGAYTNTILVPPMKSYEIVVANNGINSNFWMQTR